MSGGGRHCLQKGLSALSDLRHPDRLTTPLLRIDGELREVSWETALAAFAARVGPLLDTSPARLGVFGSGALTNEKSYLLGKLARVGFGTPNIDYNGRFCMSSAATAMNRSFGLDRGLGFPLADVAKADLILLFGANIAETLPPLMQFLKAAKDRGATIVNIDPRSTPGLSQLHLNLYPGTDHLLAGLLLKLMGEWGRLRPSAPADGQSEVLDSVAHLTPEQVAAACGLDLDDVLKVARLYAQAQHPLILSGRGPEQQTNGTDTVSALINLAFLSGHFGKPGGGYGTLTGQGNGQGGREHGQKNDQLPGYRHLNSPADRAHMAAFWGVPESALPGVGKSAQELLLSCGDEIEALVVIGSNPAVSAPGAALVREKLAALDFLVVIDVLPSETALMADLVLPGSMWAEEEGTTTNLEGRVQRRRRAMTVPGLAREDWRILCDLARAVGRGEKFQYSDFAALQQEFFAATAGGKADYSGLSAERLDTGTFQWPVPHAQHSGTPHPYFAPYATASGRAQLHAVQMSVPERAPLTLTTGRIGNQYQSGTQSRRNPALRGTPEVQMHPETARQHGISHGQSVHLSGPHGETVLPAQLTPKVRPGVAFVAFHWPGSANELTSAHALDPYSRMPAFKSGAVGASVQQPVLPGHSPPLRLLSALTPLPVPGDGR
ncbi:molybdopterin oxidoreductase family protein (plasmid) [Deinococcus sp. KNUC1210]|uniref:molybdopterin oxidoreductase family protein n=1 Tax=Deinococcus sp. KNUC1210 TaxID=2917691 RepID=UPI001EF1503D|nr:molybdopterin oxidoreductase family protein [Deinococcus sp. KNUC1210]ULH17194.1 molybdopterin oxidoreductase family protein [Deinococcus sp. KNUC1210]